MPKFDYLIIGAGIYGATFAEQMTAQGKNCLVIDKEDHVGGHCYTKKVEGIDVHVYGAHIFHTSDQEVWDYVNRFATFNRYTNSPIANYKGQVYNLPFNMNTFNKLWGVVTPEEALAKIEEQRKEIQGEPQNLEEQAIQLVGRDVYETLVKGYTEKQWGRPCTELPAFIIRRLPVRLIYDNNYFNDPYQGIPTEGYTKLVEAMLEGSEVRLGINYFDHQDLKDEAKAIVYTGPIDAWYDYCYGPLEYRSLRFETEIFDQENYQGVAVMNFTDRETPYTRRIEHKHFNFGTQEKTVVSKEYPLEWRLGLEPYYPLNDAKNQALFAKYQARAKAEKNLYFGGRLGEYKYYNMDQAIRAALDLAASLV